MTKASVEREMAAVGAGCLGRAAPDEPVFVLRGQDKLAPALVDAWASLAAEHGMDPKRVEEARDCAQQMRDWSTRKFPD